MELGASSDDEAGAATGMDLARIKARMPKKVFRAGNVDACDPAVLLNAQLFESIGIDDNEQVLLWLKHGAPINSRNDVHGNGATPMIEATTRKNRWLVDHLVTLGADANLADEMGRTPLHVACRLHDVDLARAILKSKDVHLNAQMEGTLNTPLHIAAYDGHLPLCRLLLKRGADVNAVNANGEPALHLATRRRHDDAALLLIDSGANVLIRTNNTGHLALHLACQYGSMPVASQMVERGVSMHERETAGRSALDIARAFGHYRLATELLGIETARRERAEKARVRGVKTRIAAEIAAKKAQEEYERRIRREAAAAKRAEEERLEAERIRAEAAAVKKAADDARRAATNRILRVAKEAKARRDKAAAIEAKKRAKREAEEAAREEEKRQERIAYRERIHAAATRRVKRAQRAAAKQKAKEDMDAAVAEAAAAMA